MPGADLQVRSREDARFLSRHADPRISDAAQYLLECALSPERTAAVKAKYPRLAAAESAWADPVLQQKLKVLLLADCQVDEIAWLTKLDPQGRDPDRGALVRRAWFRAGPAAGSAITSLAPRKTPVTSSWPPGSSSLSWPAQRGAGRARSGRERAGSPAPRPEVAAAARGRAAGLVRPIGKLPGVAEAQPGLPTGRQTPPAWPSVSSRHAPRRPCAATSLAREKFEWDQQQDQQRQAEKEAIRRARHEMAELVLAQRQRNSRPIKRSPGNARRPRPWPPFAGTPRARANPAAPNPAAPNPEHFAATVPESGGGKLLAACNLRQSAQPVPLPEQTGLLGWVSSGNGSAATDVEGSVTFCGRWRSPLLRQSKRWRFPAGRG